MDGVSSNVNNKRWRINIIEYGQTRINKVNPIQSFSLISRLVYTYIFIHIYIFRCFYCLERKYHFIHISQQTNGKFSNLMPMDIRHEKLIFHSYTNKTFCFVFSNQQEQDWFWILYSFQFQLNLIIPIMQPFQIFIISMELLYWIFLFDVFHSNGQLNFFWRFFSIIYIPTILHTCFNEHSFHICKLNRKLNSFSL